MYLLLLCTHSMRHQLRNSYFWPDWSSYVRLGVFHTIFSTKKVAFLFFPKNLSQILNFQILNICRVLYTSSHILIFFPESQSQILKYHILNICRVLYTSRVYHMTRLCSVSFLFD